MGVSESSAVWMWPRAGASACGHFGREMLAAPERKESKLYGFLSKFLVNITKSSSLDALAFTAVV